MNAGRDLLLFLFFLIALGVAWFVTGGPSKPLSRSGWFINPLAPLGSGGGYSLPSAPSVNGGANASTSSGVSENATPQQQSQNQSPWSSFFGFRTGFSPLGATANSPYAPYVRIEPTGAFSTDPQEEYIVLETSPELQGSITVTGWTLEEAQHDLKLPIGGAAVVPYLGQLNTETPVTVGPSAEVVIVTGKSPNGSSFRVSKCVGYFSQFQSFSPTLPTDCPLPRDEMLRHPELTSDNSSCQRFVETLTQCTLADRNTIPEGVVGSACKDFILNTLSYNGCVAEHRSDPDFLRNEWRIYLGRDQKLWDNAHDDIRLLDENGKLVAEASY